LDSKKIIPLFSLEQYNIYQRRSVALARVSSQPSYNSAFVTPFVLGSREFAKGEAVLALFSGTTVLYPAKVLVGPRKVRCRCLIHLPAACCC
jgi:hypothetical protein